MVLEETGDTVNEVNPQHTSPRWDDATMLPLLDHLYLLDIRSVIRERPCCVRMLHLYVYLQAVIRLLAMDSSPWLTNPSN
jgi:hypothetical protein